MARPDGAPDGPGGRNGGADRAGEGGAGSAGMKSVRVRLRSGFVSEQVSRRAVVACLLLIASGGAPLHDSPILPPEARDLWPGRGTVIRRGRLSTVVGSGASSGGEDARGAADDDKGGGKGGDGKDGGGSGGGGLEELAVRADRAGLRVARVLGRPVRPLVIVPDSAQEAARLARVARVDGLAAMADGGRVIVVPELFATLTPTGKDVVLAHELTHVAAGTDGLPIWLYEGFADYVGYRDAGLPVTTVAAELAAEVRAGRLPDALPGSADFAADGRDPARPARAYQEAWLACRFLADRFGEETLVRLYRAARTTGADRALAARGLTVATLTARWRAYVRDQLG
ncbi:hypothetical protein GCM10009733_085280 [Nonomuraea maheshkhaliensis]|uniref:Peptidase MA-like domain-containing protein n=1 Tax=Nonomuraea maheshkhaliensis TaxID=419590 RepID=A0ABP4SU64_9ACTN